MQDVQDADDDQDRTRQRDDDPEDEAQLPGAVDPGAKDDLAAHRALSWSRWKTNSTRPTSAGSPASTAGPPRGTAWSGRVVGVDLAEPMVRQTAAEIARRGLSNAEVRVMDAEELDLPAGSFDVVLCGFAVFFFPRLDAALGGFRRVLRPGGRVGVSQARNVDPRWRWENELFARYGPPTPPATAPGEDLRAPGALAARLGRAGFGAARELREEFAVEWRDADEWWAALWTHGTRLPLEAMAPDALAAFEAAGRAQVEAMARMGDLRRRWELIVVVAERPPTDRRSG